MKKLKIFYIIESMNEQFPLHCLFVFLNLSPPPLSQSVRLYFLGKETMEQEEEDSLATGNTGGGPCRHCTHRRHSYPCHDYWHPCICGKEGEALEMHSLTVAGNIVKFSCL